MIGTPQGPVKARIARQNDGGVLDHFLTPVSGREVFVPMRVVSNAAGSEVIFTVFQQPGMPDENFARDIGWVEEDLNTLKTIMERQVSGADID